MEDEKNKLACNTEKQKLHTTSFITYARVAGEIGVVGTVEGIVEAADLAGDSALTNWKPKIAKREKRRKRRCSMKIEAGRFDSEVVPQLQNYSSDMNPIRIIEQFRFSTAAIPYVTRL